MLKENLRLKIQAATNQMQIILASNSHWISRGIRKWCWCEYSHVGILIDDYVIESRGTTTLDFFLVLTRLKPNSPALGGVVKTHIDDFKAEYTKTEVREIPGDASKALQYIGLTPYDTDGFLGHIIRRDIENPEWLTCLELIAICLDGYDITQAYKLTTLMLQHFSKLVEE